MAVSAKLLSPPIESGQTFYENVVALAVAANSDDEAEQIAKALYGGDSDKKWEDTVITDLTAVTTALWGGWTARVIATDPVTPFTVIDVSVTAAATDTFAALMADMVTALNATAINGAAFTSDTLKVAETTDGIGDWAVVFSLTDPDGVEFADLYVDTITDGGVTGAVLTVALKAAFDRTLPPRVVAEHG
jgi:hypothetical protein